MVSTPRKTGDAPQGKKALEGSVFDRENMPIPRKTGMKKKAEEVTRSTVF